MPILSCGTDGARSRSRLSFDLLMRQSDCGGGRGKLRLPRPESRFPSPSPLDDYLQPMLFPRTLAERTLGPARPPQHNPPPTRQLTRPIKLLLLPRARGHHQEAPGSVGQCSSIHLSPNFTSTTTPVAKTGATPVPLIPVRQPNHDLEIRDLPPPTEPSLITQSTSPLSQLLPLTTKNDCSSRLPTVLGRRTFEGPRTDIYLTHPSSPSLTLVRIFSARSCC